MKSISAYQEQIQFIKVYIREAHPVDGWWFGKGFMNILLRLSGSKVSWEIYDPTTIEERRNAAGDCAESLQYGVKTYVDEMNDQVNKDYAAWPTRLYLIDKNGLCSLCRRFRTLWIQTRGIKTGYSETSPRGQYIMSDFVMNKDQEPLERRSDELREDLFQRDVNQLAQLTGTRSANRGWREYF